MRVRHLFALAACSLSAAVLIPETLNAQDGTLYGSAPFGSVGSVAAVQGGQNYGASRPMQTDSVGSSYQSMSPDSWGNSASSGPDPFAAGLPGGASGTAWVAPPVGAPGVQGNGAALVQQDGSNSFVPPTRELPTQPSYTYGNTGAPSMKALLGTSEPTAPPTSRSLASPNTFRSVEFDQKDPRDIPLAPTVPMAPTVPSSVLDGSGNQMDTTEPTLSGPAAEPNLSAPAGPVVNAPRYFDVAPGFASDSSVDPVRAPEAVPYQMPQVFDSAPPMTMQNPSVQNPVAPPVQDSGGFGWGNAPGMWQRGSQSSPTYRQQPAKEPGASRERKWPRFPLPFGIRRGGGQGAKSDSAGIEHSQQPMVPPSRTPAMTMPNQQFRPDLGQRSPLPTVRNFGTYDSGRKEYDFENKKTQYPPFREILATGRYFGSIEGQFLKPRFNGNSGLAIVNRAGGINATDAQVFDFDFEFIPNLRFGFESKYGPGFEVDFRTIRTASVVQSLTSTADSSASLRAALPDLAVGTQIETAAAGQTLSGAHTFNLESYGFSVFKEVQLPITRIGGAFGFHAMDIDHQVDATVVDGAGSLLQSLNTRSDMRAFGPRIRLDYFRPVGHTPLEFITSAGGSVLFGKRDQFISGPGASTFQRVGTDEIVTTFEFLSALQIKQRIGESRSVYGRIGYLNQAFNGGGSGFLAQDDFGLRGITFALGVNR